MSSANFGIRLPLGCLAFVGCKNDASGHYADPLFRILPNLRLLCESTVFCRLCKQVYRNTRLQPLGILQGKFKAMKKYELFFHEPIEKKKKKKHPEKTPHYFSAQFCQQYRSFSHSLRNQHIFKSLLLMVLNIRKRLPFTQQLFWDTERKGKQSKLSKIQRKPSMQLKTCHRDWNRKEGVCKGGMRRVLGLQHPSTAQISHGSISALLHSYSSL